jgi:hypothetical protein
MKTHIPSAHAILTHPTLAEGLGALFSSEPSTVNIAAAVNVKVDEDKIDRIVSDVATRLTRVARRATQGKYKQDAG